MLSIIYGEILKLQWWQHAPFGCRARKRPIFKHTHMHIYVCVCVCVYICHLSYMVKSQSCSGGSTPLSAAARANDASASTRPTVQKGGRVHVRKERFILVEQRPAPDLRYKKEGVFTLET